MTGADDRHEDQGLPRGVRLGVDVGDVRVGLARSDLDGMIATPVETLDRASATRRVADEAAEADARVIMVGLPRSLNGTEGRAAEKARAFVGELSVFLEGSGQDVEIRLLDERLTTVTAHQALHSAGRKGRKHRKVVDQVAAVMILQQALDIERSTGRRAGELVESISGRTPSTDQEDDG
ncbi:Holliday junction resolvase RuvX [Brachybacterium tyrofermentans]|uniref:Holliday junction resolvase RuvX n=1 Tax=Brachybacterium tyrofermentans TaxID=47848 RepID=UPI000A1ACC99|nr:Holliday junction resolvase RuvX [Brachybacterium tyrofermentans]SLN04834.1 Putative Holliday junction resolvase YggF [Corynebacterium xerosis]